METNTTELTRLRIDGERLWQSIMDLAKVGATPRGGVKRLALTDLDRDGRDLVVSWLKAAGLTVRIDQLGNIFGRRAGTDTARGAVASGSHIDTQPSGGRFDGNYGVLATLEVIRTLNDHNIQTAAPIEVAIWTNEEGTRFTPVMMGSGAYAGVFTLDEVLAAQDLDGVTVGEELDRIGYAGDTALGAHPFDAYFEAHIEQGPILEDCGMPIGVVTGALGQRWFDVIVTGMDAHAGPTPMNLRRDAGLAMAKIIQGINEIALAEAPDGRGTVGFVQVGPNSRNVIPGNATFSVDLRHPNKAGLERMEQAFRERCAATATDTRTDIRIEHVTEFPPCEFDRDCVSLVREAAADQGHAHRDIVSGAGHDAVYVARVAPTAMIFVPCKDGISHNEIEDASPADIEAGANVLLAAMLARAA
ncbi:MAG: Zn-dependent hydrolase [Burkholderiaceae bacterium]